MPSKLENLAKVVALVLAGGAPLAAKADLINVTWTPPTAREDGTALPPAEIDGYRLVWTVSGSVQPDKIVPAGAQYTLDTGALRGLVCVKMATIDTDGLESVLSDQACRKSRPNRPTNLRIR